MQLSEFANGLVDLMAVQRHILIFDDWSPPQLRQKIEGSVKLKVKQLPFPR